MHTLHAKRDVRIAELEAENAQLRAAQIDLLAQFDRELARIAELECQLGLSSQNSSKPPSSVGPKQRPGAHTSTTTGPTEDLLGLAIRCRTANDGRVVDHRRDMQTPVEQLAQLYHPSC